MGLVPFSAAARGRACWLSGHPFPCPAPGRASGAAEIDGRRAELFCSPPGRTPALAPRQGSWRSRVREHPRLYTAYPGSRGVV